MAGSICFYALPELPATVVSVLPLIKQISVYCSFFQFPFLAPIPWPFVSCLLLWCGDPFSYEPERRDHVKSFFETEKNVHWYGILVTILKIDNKSSKMSKVNLNNNYKCHDSLLYKFFKAWLSYFYIYCNGTIQGGWMRWRLRISSSSAMVTVWTYHEVHVLLDGEGRDGQVLLGHEARDARQHAARYWPTV